MGNDQLILISWPKYKCTFAIFIKIKKYAGNIHKAV